MRDAAEVLPSAKRAATVVDDDGEVTMKDIVRIMGASFNQVLHGQSEQIKHCEIVRQALSVLQQQTQRSFAAMAARVDQLEANCGSGERGKATQAQIDSIAADVRRVSAELRRGGATYSASAPGPSTGTSAGTTPKLEQRTIVLGSKQQDTPEEGALDIGRSWLEAVRCVIPASVEVICPYKSTSAINLRHRSSAEARDALEILRLVMQARTFQFKGKLLEMRVVMLQTRECRARNRILLQSAEILRDAEKHDIDQHIHLKKPYAFVWRGASLIFCGKIKARFNEDRIANDFEEGRWG